MFVVFSIVYAVHITANKDSLMECRLAAVYQKIYCFSNKYSTLRCISSCVSITSFFKKQFIVCKNIMITQSCLSMHSGAEKKMHSYFVTINRYALQRYQVANCWSFLNRHQQGSIVLKNNQMSKLRTLDKIMLVFITGNLLPQTPA